MEQTQPPVTAAQLQAAQYDLHVAPSTVFGGGLGVFTSLPIHPHQILGVLGGTITTQESSSQNETSRTLQTEHTFPPPHGKGKLEAHPYVMCHMSIIVIHRMQS